MCIDPSRLTKIRTRLLHNGIPDLIWIRLKQLGIARTARERQKDDRRERRRARNNKHQERRWQRKQKIRESIRNAKLSVTAKPFIPTTTDKLPKIITTNARSIVNKIEHINQLIEDSKADIVCISETWTTPENNIIIKNQLNNEYHKLSSPRPIEDMRGGGTLVLIKKSFSKRCVPIELEPIPKPEWVNHTDMPKIELKMVKAYPNRLPRGYSYALVICVYIAEFTTSKQKAAMWALNSQLENALTKTSNGSEPLIIIAGDFNGSNVSTLCNANQLYRVNESATRGRNCLDLILTNAPKCYQSEIWPPLGKSDHSVVVAIPTLHAYNISKPPTSKKWIKSGNISDTVHLIRNTDWDHIRNKIQIDLQAATDMFYTTVKAAEDICQPLKSVKSKEDKPWMTLEIKKMMQERQRLFHSNKKKKWHEISNKIKFKIRSRKKEYFQNKYVLGNPNWWKEVNELRENTNKCEADVELASSLNEGFYNVWNGNVQSDISRFINKKQFHDTSGIFTHSLIINNLGKLNKCTTGPDDLSTRLLKESSLEIADILLELFSNYIKSSFVPTQWKLANITPIPKVDHPKDSSDYRPISVTSILSKVFERIISKLIIDKTKNIWMHNNQHGFLPGRSTMDAIIKVIDDWAMAIDNKESMTAIFFDFAKAFDLVDHEILLTKLTRLLPDWLTSWTASYLNNRKQRVRMNDIETE